MRRVVLSAVARRDLLAIWEYIARDNIQAADRVVEEVRNALETLAQMPGLGHQRAEIRDPRHRVWLVYKYLIIYRWTVRTLTVVRIVHGARNLRRIIR